MLEESGLGVSRVTCHTACSNTYKGIRFPL